MYMWSSEGQNMGMTSYPIIYLDLAANVIGKIGSYSSICIYNESLMIVSLSLLKKPYQLNFQLQQIPNNLQIRSHKAKPAVIVAF